MLTFQTARSEDWKGTEGTCKDHNFKLSKVLDVFYYHDLADSWLRCPPHIDPGLVTLVVADQEGLEAQDGKNWVPLHPLQPLGAAFALIGAEWAYCGSIDSTVGVDCQCQPCMHRVRVKERTCRASAALEFRLTSQRRELLAQHGTSKCRTGIKSFSLCIQCWAMTSLTAFAAWCYMQV